jgi:hypothetical protein
VGAFYLRAEFEEGRDEEGAGVGVEGRSFGDGAEPLHEGRQRARVCHILI